MSRLRAAGRLAAAGLLVAGLSGTVATAVSWLILDDSSFTTPPASTPITTTINAPAGATTASPAPQAAPSAWPLGSCVTSWQPTTATSCTTRGALRIVGIIHRTGRSEPCADVPETSVVRRTDRYALCLTTP